MICSQACLVVHKNSVPYIKNVLAALIDALQSVFGSECQMVTCSSLDSAEVGDAELIFIIGENLGRFKRLPGRRYVYLNFSVVVVLGNPLQRSFKGFQLIRHKNNLLQRKLDLFDAILDYYPPQTRILARKLKIPVAGFVPWVLPPSPQHNITLTDRPYDVCFVGGISPRRKKVLEELRSAGCVLSPSSGENLEDIAARSRCTLNIHKQRSNHLEIPRVLGTLASASPLITENSYGISELLPQELVYAATYRKLVDKTLSALSNTASLAETAKLAQRWYFEVGAPRFKATFVSAVKKIDLTVPRR